MSSIPPSRRRGVLCDKVCDTELVLAEKHKWGIPPRGVHSVAHGLSVASQTEQPNRPCAVALLLAVAVGQDWGGISHPGEGGDELSVLRFSASEGNRPVSIAHLPSPSHAPDSVVSTIHVVSRSPFFNLLSHFTAIHPGRKPRPFTGEIATEWNTRRNKTKGVKPLAKTETFQD
jgi:hypothetical protein